MNVSQGKTHLQFPCKNCGAQLEFTPGAQALTCGYCGHKEEIPSSENDVIEHPFEDYKGSLEVNPWDTETIHMDCDQCGASTEAPAETHALECAFCGAPLVTKDERSESRKPESVLPFTVPQSECDDIFRAWVKSLWFRPNALKTLARPDALSGVYIPYWTYDALTQSWWNAESGTYYYVTETYQSGGKTRTRTVRKTRWTWVSGDHHAFYDDVQVPGSRSLDREMLRGVEPFNTHAVVPYAPELLSGFRAENYQVDMLECWKDAELQMTTSIREACAQKIPGDTHRNLRVSTHYSNQTYKLCLLPVWVANYRYKGKVYRYLVNGDSGKVFGQAPWSWPKIISTLLGLGVAGWLAFEAFQGGGSF